MKDFTTPRTFILSAYKGRDASKDLHAHYELSCDLALEGIPFREARGCYKGQEEQCFVVIGAENQRAVELFARAYDQETYLVIAENDRTAYLVDTQSGYHKHLGKFQSVGAERPEADAWTLVDDNYFTTDGRPGVDLPGGL